MGSIRIGFLIAITIGTTHNGYLEAKQVPNSLGGYDFMIPSFEEPKPMNYPNNNKNQRYTMVYFGDSENKNRDSTHDMLTSLQKDPEPLFYKDAEIIAGFQNYKPSSMGKDRDYKRNQLLREPIRGPKTISDYSQAFDMNQESPWFQRPHGMFPSFQKEPEPLVHEDAEMIAGFQNHGPSSMGKVRDYQDPTRSPKSISDYSQPFKMNQDSSWFKRPEVSVEHVYDTEPIDADSNQDNLYRSPQELQTQDDKNSSKAEGSEEEKLHGEEEEHWFGSHKPSADVKTIERPYFVKVVKKTGVPKPHPVEIPTPQLIKVRTPHPYVVLESVPVPVAVPIYKLVPEVVEKKVPIEVEKLVPMYKDKPYKVIMEKPYKVYVNRPYPVYETIYKHVYRKKKPSYNGFVDKFHRHH